ncbi:chemotaxis protein CheW [Marinobacter shengliensis]|uniref:chemotaxis protein CheW n=1 Tax=Marinobacter shengliensis TaxID=1389223 RepID=UPI000D0F3C2D|nr:chemotaxis protein CheW [Marinobacter shengliensis]PSF10939.1 chemotaxis protein CheW [Marinobacter shengliensis]
MADKKMAQLATPDAAIASYLDELLHTATSSAQVQEPEKVQPAPEPKTETIARVREKTAEIVKREPAPVIEKAPPAPPVSAEVVLPQVQEVRQPEVAVATTPEPVPASTEPPTRPEWSHGPFECLIFTVAGLQLAVPLVLLGAIHRIEEEIRPIPGSPRWYMGIRPDRDHNLRVVDTAEWIMAGRVPAGARDNYRFVIRLDDSDWGLACDDVAQSFTLKPDEVRWRTARSKRPWLAGTVIDHMCALIDVRTMAHLLVRAEREHHLDLS